MSRRTIVALALLACAAAATRAAAQYSCTAEPDSLNFSSVIAGSPKTLAFTLSNHGTATLAGSVLIEGAYFRFANGTGSLAISVPPGGDETISVECIASWAGPFNATVVFPGDACAPLPCYAYGQPEPRLLGGPCWVTPSTPYSMGAVPIGEEALGQVGILNNWEGLHTGVMPGGEGGFSVLWSGPYEVTYFRTWQVRFRPTTAGEQSYTFVAHESRPPVTFTGIGLTTWPSCEVAPTALDFGPVAVGAGASQLVRVLNTGNSLLTLQVPTACGEFMMDLASGTVGIPPGESRHVRVNFLPVTPGAQECVLDLGNPLCPPITLRGTGLAGGGAQDVIGVYFDQSGALDRYATTEPYEPVTAYLCIMNPSAAFGVQGWECCVDVVGGAVGLEWELAGTAVNVEAAPCFEVGLASGPLLGQYVIRLATVTFLQPDPQQPTWFYVRPLEQPSLPGVPCYADGIDPGALIPLAIASGSASQPVAAVNDPLTDVLPEAPASVTTLSPNAPNPFNPATTVRFTLAAAGRATLEVFDVAGRRVRVLADGELAAGTHERRWDGRDQSGKALASGAYFLRLNAPDAVLTRRAVLLR